MILGSPNTRFELEPNLSLSYLSLTRNGVNNMGILKQIYRELGYLGDFEPRQFLGCRVQNGDRTSDFQRVSTVYLCLVPENEV